MPQPGKISGRASFAFRGDADARIGDRYPQPLRRYIREPFDANHYRSVGSKLYRVSQQITQDLPNARGISSYLRRKKGRNLAFQFQPFDLACDRNTLSTSAIKSEGAIGAGFSSNRHVQCAQDPTSRLQCQGAFARCRRSGPTIRAAPVEIGIG